MNYLEFGVKLLRRMILVCLDAMPDRSMSTAELHIWISARHYSWATRDMVESCGQWLAEQGYVETSESATGIRLTLTDRGADIAKSRVRVPGVAKSATEA